EKHMQTQENDILTSIASGLARAEAVAADALAKVAKLKQAQELLVSPEAALATGTGAGTPGPKVPSRAERRLHARPRTSHAVVRAEAAPPPAPAAITARIREILEQRSETSLRLASLIGTTPDLMQSSLDALERSGQVHRFIDGAYTWKVGAATSDVLTAVIMRYMTERHVSRRDLMRAIGVEDKLLEKRVDNQLDYVRETEPVWGQKDAEGHWLYWLVGGQKPP